jgi:hypothetical protein
MLRLAHVTADDVVYDLGSGDGRICDRGANLRRPRRGIEIQRIWWRCRERSPAQAVADKVTVIEGDLFTADISEASVVTLWLSQGVNARLEPKLRAAAPGTRIVSHQFRSAAGRPTRRVTRITTRPTYFSGLSRRGDARATARAYMSTATTSSQDAAMLHRRRGETTAFTVLAAISFSHLLNDTIQSLIPALYPILKSSFALSFSQVGLLTLTLMLTASLLQPVVGSTRTTGPRRIRSSSAWAFR